MKKTIDNLNNQGLMAYQIKCIIALIEHFEYNYEEWREILEYLTDYTWLTGVSENEHGIRATSSGKWAYESSRWLPATILDPFLMPDANSKRNIWVCKNCNRLKYQFSEYGATYGLCLNSHSCEYVRKKYELPRLKSSTIDEKFKKKVHELYMRTDFNLLRAVNNALNIDSDISYEFFEKGRVVYLWDTLKILDSLNIPYPDMEGIHDYAFGKENERFRFSTYNLIKQEK